MKVLTLAVLADVPFTLHTAAEGFQGLWVVGEERGSGT